MEGHTGFYEWCRGEGVYLNMPDWYFLNGGSKTGMGYRETNWSLPREYQEIIERQNIFDGTWEKTPSMGWMFVPLTEYQGGGPRPRSSRSRTICRTTSSGWRTSSAPACRPVTAGRGFTTRRKPAPW